MMCLLTQNYVLIEGEENCIIKVSVSQMSRVNEKNTTFFFYHFALVIFVFQKHVMLAFIVVCYQYFLTGQ